MEKLQECGNMRWHGIFDELEPLIRSTFNSHVNVMLLSW